MDNRITPEIGTKARQAVSGLEQGLMRYRAIVTIVDKVAAVLGDAQVTYSDVAKQALQEMAAETDKNPELGAVIVVDQCNRLQALWTETANNESRLDTYERPPSFRVKDGEMEIIGTDTRLDHCGSRIVLHASGKSPQIDLRDHLGADIFELRTGSGHGAHIEYGPRTANTEITISHSSEAQPFVLKMPVNLAIQALQDTPESARKVDYDFTFGSNKIVMLPYTDKLEHFNVDMQLHAHTGIKQIRQGVPIYNKGDVSANSGILIKYAADDVAHRAKLTAQGR